MLVGEVAKECVEHVGVEYHYRIYSERTLSPAVQFHGRWLMKLLDLLVCAKVREYRLAQQAQIKAIYETGAKLTHDIKNILQALNTFIELVDDVEDGEALPLIRYQLPTLAHRLAHTLAKLNAPAVESSRLEHIEAWWYLVKARYAGREIDFESEGLALISNSDDLINIDVLDSVVENLLENARYKRQSLQRSNSGGANMGIVTRLVIEAGQFSVTVTDEGCAIPAEKSDQLFKQAIESEKGYGIGLYQCAKSARRFGYHLVLSENREGCVQFKISGSLQSKQSTSECLEMGTK